jgi:hypothetical protein
MICRVGSALALALVGGPAISLTLGWLNGQPMYSILANPLNWFVRSAFIGCLFLLLPLLAGRPARYLASQLAGGSRWRVHLAVAVTAACGGTAALLLVREILDLSLGLRFGGYLAFDKLIAVNCLVVAAVSIAISGRDRLRAERDAAAARAASATLLAQIRPHFLFNTLNTISAQVREDPVGAQENLGRLSDMFRYTMNLARSEAVPLDQEVALAREYLLLEKARFGNRLTFELPENTRDIDLPGLTLQPLVENAVRHGIAKRVNGGCVTVTIERAEGQCRLKVRNPIPASAPLTDDKLFRNGHALWILRQRLPKLTVMQQPNGVFEVDIPLG